MLASQLCRAAAGRPFEGGPYAGFTALPNGLVHPAARVLLFYFKLIGPEASMPKDSVSVE